MKKTPYGFEYNQEFNRALRRRWLCRLAADVLLAACVIVLGVIICQLVGHARPAVLITFLVACAVAFVAFCIREHLHHQ